MSTDDAVGREERDIRKVLSGGSFDVSATPERISFPSPRVTALEARRRGQRGAVTERMYECDNGWAVLARRGTALDRYSDPDWEQHWEMWVRHPEGMAVGDSLYGVTDDQLAKAASNLSEWFEASHCPTANPGGIS